MKGRKKEDVLSRASIDDRGSYASFAPHPQMQLLTLNISEKMAKKGRILSTLKPAAIMVLDHIQGEDLVEIHPLRGTTLSTALCPPLQQRGHLDPAPGNPDKTEGVIF